MSFVDEVKVRVLSGAGGNGCISFRREKYIPRGGPDGGNGGRGGNVYLHATRNKSSLLDFKYRPKFEAGRGQHGMGSDMDGHSGEDLDILVPVGTIVKDLETGDLLGDLDADGKVLQVAKGGRGGRGNKTFANSRVRAPRIAQPGGPGEELHLLLELRLLADVGLVGLPNAGKSSLLRALSKATPKVADYPFTTLEPALGVVYAPGMPFVMADLPGLIEGAAEGHGLGHRFLKHALRNHLLLQCVEASESLDTITQDITIIENELKNYSPDLISRERIIGITKSDLIEPKKQLQLKRQLKKKGVPTIWFSSATGAGLKPLVKELSTRLRREA